MPKTFTVWLRDLLDELGISRVTLVGQSLGGGVAMQFVHQHPAYCERLVLIGSGGLGPEVAGRCDCYGRRALNYCFP